MLLLPAATHAPSAWPHTLPQRMDTSGRTVLDPTAGGGAQTAKQMFGKVRGRAGYGSKIREPVSV